MFPLRDDNPTSSRPIMVYAIIAVNVLVWSFVQGFGTSPQLAISICRFGLVPGELLGSVPAGTQFRVSRTIMCSIDENANWMSVIMSMFMHGGWLHILGNMWFLFVFGDNVEDRFGKAQFVIFYLVCGLAAAGAQIAAAPASTSPMVGASGAIGGVMGAYALMFPGVRIEMLVFLGFFITRIGVPAAFMLGYWFVLQLLSASTSSGGMGGVAFWAHIGGFLAGMGMALLFTAKYRLAGPGHG
ncbi:MAG: rhomboid family intramembrane serine protease [Chitinivibrionales bacterium]|nr:rhomboid family intramembrane serine protease [Chitinivibrionales bacterium]